VTARYIGWRNAAEKLLLGLWLAGNVWLAKPWHWDTIFLRFSVALFLIVNPMVFLYLGWRGRRAKRRASRVWLILVLGTWVLAPPIWAMFHWGPESFKALLMRGYPWYSWVYCAGCVGLCPMGQWLSTRQITGRKRQDDGGSRNAVSHEEVR